MRLTYSLLCYGIAACLMLCTASARHVRVDSRHHASSANHTLSKRYDEAEFTYYYIAQGEVACGGWYKDTDAVVALNYQQFDNGAHCGKQVEMTWEGKTQTATIVDECPAPCPYGALDLTVSLFTNFAGSIGPGRLFGGSWNYAGQAPPPPPTTIKSSPTPSPPPPPPPTTTSHTHEPTPTSTSSAYTSTEHTHSIASSIASSRSSSAAASSSAAITSSSSEVSSQSTSSSVASSSASVPSATSSNIPAAGTSTSAIRELLVGYMQLAALDAAAMGPAA
ncbi:hypothetical protein NM688_g2924 [Phlebia brevispora]|uniref:Uncharacterized protein n=1 Tax=Phlebia brevispora TaxID=194682 RepID=A0ACC1T741_9APHY|nr:hypothetical protein NM688_g2924 [Phlebia brevispora]